MQLVFRRQQRLHILFIFLGEKVKTLAKQPAPDPDLKILHLCTVDIPRKNAVKNSRTSRLKRCVPRFFSITPAHIQGQYCEAR